MIYDRFENLDLYAQSGTRLHWALTYAHDTHRPGCHLREKRRIRKIVVKVAVG